MSNSAAKRPAGWELWWGWAVVAGVLLVGVLLFGLHARQTAQTRQSLMLMRELREARLDLAKGYLHLSQAGEPGGPYTAEQGQVLLHQALNGFESSLVRGEVLLDPLAAVEGLRTRLDNWPRMSRPTPADMVEFRSAFHAVEKAADAADAELQAGLRRQTARNRLEFIIAATVAMAVLLVAGGLVFQLQKNAVRQARERRTSDDRLRGLLGDMMEGCQLHDRDYRYLYLNEAAARNGRRRREELLGRTVFECYPGFEQSALFAAMKLCMEQRTARRIEEEFVFPDGKSAWFELNIEPAPEGIFIHSIEVTERHRAEAELRESRERFARAFRTSPVPQALGRLSDHALIEVNDAFLQLFGWPRELVIGRTPLELGLVAPEELTRVREELAGREQLENFQLEVRSRIGQLRTVSLGLARIELQGVPHAIVTLFDITERRRAEQAVAELNQNLEKIVAQRTAELQSKNRELETFTYSVSHDLKAPLRGIDGYSRLLLEEHAAQLDTEGMRFLQAVRNASVQMGQLIDDLLAYSQLERRSLRPGRLRLSAVLGPLQAVLAPEIAQRGVDLRVNVPDIEVLADPDGLAQVLRNLLDNALKFTRDVRPPVIEIGGRGENGAFTLWVRDNGIGFDMKFTDRIFDIFQRLHRVEEYPGTGIGLAIVRKAMERMGGKVRAESAPGRGATFYLELPTP
ncbi:MAG TPA: PAS domain S-box protein [Opitutaceae bacterium]|nr:PAS domain S-box protein [Opitutaceae bacterium]HRJ47916.1 PAS domain S-box protein [Opitutaceae bacterium]